MADARRSSGAVDLDGAAGAGRRLDATATTCAARVAVMLDGGCSTHALRGGDALIGRAADCDIVIDHPSVSRRHAVLRVGPPMTLEDLGISNGTRVGAAIDAKRRAHVAFGALVELGAALVLVEEPVAPRPADADPGSASRLREGGAVWAPDSPLAKLAPLFDLVASGSMNVVLLGERGVGKTFVAERVHARSARASSPLVRVDCAAAERAVTAALFGDANERGALMAARGGSILLDSVGELPWSLQERLVRVLDDAPHGPVTTDPLARSVSAPPFDVRFLATSRRDPEALAAAGLLRSDLHARLAGLTIALPPLRERPMDVALLAAWFARAASQRAGRTPLSFDDDALAKLGAHRWPGNVHELRAAVERAALACSGATIGANDVPIARGIFTSARPTTSPLDLTPKAEPVLLSSTRPTIPPPIEIIPAPSPSSVRATRPSKRRS
jgi:hypothetical protein